MRSAGPNTEAEPLSLLVIEDAMIHRTIISRIGEKAGFATETASSVDAAAAVLRAREFDAITLDLALGERVGAEVLRLLADLKCRTPVIIISVSDDTIVEEACRIGRAFDLNLWKPLHKPIDLAVLRDMLEQISVCAGLRRIARA
ncbi:MAG TPA: response regulator [Xanthobacteraceae bacterium]|jgi:two-component system chemotaxis response regulator CheY